MAEESNCQYVASLPSAIPQLVLMGLIDNELVVEPACKVIGTLQDHRVCRCAHCNSDSLQRIWDCSHAAVRRMLSRAGDDRSPWQLLNER